MKFFNLSRRSAPAIALAFCTAPLFASSSTTLSLPPAVQPRITVTDRVWPQQYGEIDICLWADDKLAAYTLTIDDNNGQDLPFWLELGERYGWKWTWFIISGNVGMTGPMGGTWEGWREAAAAGHSIASHSVSHLTRGLPITEEYQVSQRTLREEISPKAAAVLAYPNGNQPPNDETLAAQHYVAVRGVKGVLNPPATINYRDVNSVSSAQNFGERESHWASFAGMTNPANPQKFRAWYSCHFHAVTGKAKPDIIAMLDLVKANESDIWVGTFDEVAMYGQERDTGTVTVNSVARDLIVFEVNDTMDDAVFTQPLCVKVRLDNSWRKAAARQDSGEIPVSLIANDRGVYALVNAVPDRGKVILKRIP